MNWLLNYFRAWERHLQQMVVVLAIALLAPLFTAPASATGIYEMPTSPPADIWVLDEADIISRFNEGKMNASFNDLAQKTGNQVRFVTIHRLDYGETVETFADQLFQKWFPTPESQTQQTLLVMDDVTNESTIRSGAAIRDRLTTDRVRSITQETILYPLKEGYKYNQAMVGAGDRITTILAGNPDPGPPVLQDNVSTEGTFASKEETQESNATVWVVALLIAATVIPMATYYLYVR